MFLFFADLSEKFFIYFSSCFAPLWRLWKIKKHKLLQNKFAQYFFSILLFWKILLSAVGGWMIFLGSVLGMSWKEFSESKLKAFLCVLQLLRFRTFCTKLFNYIIIYVPTLSHNQILFSISIIKPNALFCHNSLNFL